MYIEFLNKDIDRLKKENEKADSCIKILNELGLRACVHEVEKFIKDIDDKLMTVDRRVKDYNFKVKRENVAHLYFYINDSFNTFDSKDMKELNEVIRKFDITPNVYKDDKLLTDYFRNFYLISDDELADYEISVISDYFVRAMYLREDARLLMYTWDGKTLEAAAVIEEK